LLRGVLRLLRSVLRLLGSVLRLLGRIAVLWLLRGVLSAALAAVAAVVIGARHDFLEGWEQWWSMAEVAFEASECDE
jgi:hypothetical protein